MSTVAQSSILGRCPVCGRLVTVPAPARAAKVACPACGHPALGAAFADVEAPLPVILLPQGAERIPAPHAVALGHDPVARQEAVAAEARTHLLLDLPCLDDAEPRDPATRVISGRVSQKAVAARASAAEDAQTHLLLGSADVQDDDARNDDAQDAGAVIDDPRTRLQLAPLSLRTKKSTALQASADLLRRLIPPLLELGVWLDEALHGRWLWALAALGALCGFVAPSLDYLATEGRSTLGVFTTAFVLLGLAGLSIARLNELSSDEGRWDPKLAATRVRSAARLLIESFEQRAQSPRYEQLIFWGQQLGLLGLLGFAWAGLLGALRLVLGLSAPPTSLPMVCGLLLLAGVGLTRYGLRSAPALKFSLQESGDSLAAVAPLPPIMDLAEALPEPFSAGTTTLHRTLIALSRWRSPEWPDEASYRAALERHLQRQLPSCKIERERWVGRSRRDTVFDLVIDGLVVIGVSSEFHDACAERAIERMSRYARTWSGKPMILAIFDAPRAAVLSSSKAAALIELHREFALLTVRMPTQG